MAILYSDNENQEFTSTKKKKKKKNQFHRCHRGS